MLRLAINTTNKAGIKANVRIDLNRIYWRPYLYLPNWQVKARIPTGVQSVDTKQQRMESLKKLALELSHGCKRAVAESQTKKSRFRESKPPIDEMFLTLKLLAHVVVLNFHEYSPTPKDVWTALHQEYLQAEQLGITGMEANNPEFDPEDNSSLQLAYLQVLATSLTDPHHLPQGIVWEIYDQLSDWVKHVSLGPFKSIKNPAGLFVVNLQDSAGPIPYAKFDTKAAGPHHRLLDCSALQRLVQQHLDHLAKGQRPHESLKVSASAARSALGHLSRVWGLPPKRHFPRHDCRGP